jgi:hypothetical protein
MAGVTSTVVKESAEELTQRIKEATTAREKDKLQVLYWLKQEKAPAIKVIAKSLGHHRNTVQTWLCKYPSSVTLGNGKTEMTGKNGF